MGQAGLTRLSRPLQPARFAAAFCCPQVLTITTQSKIIIAGLLCAVLDVAAGMSAIVQDAELLRGRLLARC